MSFDPRQFERRRCLVIEPNGERQAESAAAFATLLASSFQLPAWKVSSVRNGTDARQTNPKRTAWLPEICSQLKTLGPNDIAAITVSNEDELYNLLHLSAALELQMPLDATLLVHVSEPEAFVPRNEIPFGDMLRNACSFRRAIFFTDTADSAQSLSIDFRLRIYSLEDRKSATATRNGTTTPPWCDVPPSLLTDQLGPLVLVSSALWGRTGSSTVFDSQMRYLISRGYVVANVYVDHTPLRTDDQKARVKTLLNESFAKVRPHLQFVAERRERSETEYESLQRDSNILSPVGRVSALLADATVDSRDQLVWCGKRASFGLVNHLFHFGFHQNYTKAPIVLETHDIMTDLFDSHEIPPFVPIEPDGRDLRFADEIGFWKQVSVAVNISPSDCDTVASHVHNSFFARPYAEEYRRFPRTWAQAIADNNLAATLGERDRFDVMMWGTPHLNNRKSIEWFFESVMPQDFRLAGLRILIVGRVADTLPDTIRNRSDVTIVGPVDYVEDFLDRADVLVIPDQTGTGSSIKALDALARGACFVSTRSGMRGLDTGATGYTPCQDARQFSRDLVNLLESKTARDLRKQVAETIYSLNFSREAYDKTWDKVMDAVANTQVEPRLGLSAGPAE